MKWWREGWVRGEEVERWVGEGGGGGEGVGEGEG